MNYEQALADYPNLEAMSDVDLILMRKSVKGHKFEDDDREFLAAIDAVMKYRAQIALENRNESR